MATDTTDVVYISGQLIKACPLSLRGEQNGQIKIRIKSERGATNWLNITTDQLRKIERVLDGSA